MALFLDVVSINLIASFHRADSCPFPDYIFDFRVAMCSLAIILCISNAFFKLPQKSPLVYKVWQFVIVFVAVAFFSLFILDSDATQKGYNFCMNNFKVKLPGRRNCFDCTRLSVFFTPLLPLVLAYREQTEQTLKS